MRVHRRRDHANVPWRNGAGHTLEVVREPHDGDVFNLRMSFATIERSGPFSSFEGYERVLVLAEGDALMLAEAGGPGTPAVHRLNRHEVLRFPGESAMAAEVDDPCTAFNVIARRGHVDIDLRVVDQGGRREPLVLACHAGQRDFIAVLAGSLQVSDPGTMVTVSALDVVEATPGPAAHAVGDAVVACVRVRMPG